LKDLKEWSYENNIQSTVWGAGDFNSMLLG